MANTLDDPAHFAQQREQIFARNWQLVAHESELPSGPGALPVTLLPGLLDEPLLLTRDSAGEVRALSNACTHRGALVCEEPRAFAAGSGANASGAAAAAAAAAASLRCRYHGRSFALDGRCVAAPGFPSVPAGADLPRAHVANWHGFLFASLAPAMPFAEWIAELEARTAWLPVARAVFDPTRSRDYDVPAHWSLYCENFLEGFHVPFVHAALAPTLDLPRYRCETFRWSNVQVGVAGAQPADQQTALHPPSGAPYHGQALAGLYFCLFPSTLVNVYPWGLSLNLVQPLAPRRTRVAFRTWVWDAALLDRGAGAGLHRVELEDEEVVSSVQRGVASRLWRGGTLAPGHEDCVAHFRRLVESTDRAASGRVAELVRVDRGPTP
ncbi:MAG: aromatic ring-hydroxylating oxygenase subunit alpha [Planctomycetota bacterium]